eukprot:CAMPEP_0169081338 /NCGR_PEP_ID=MMETSP1015-20121227/10955_1 /TAXON_ID=342587 /ORGANISM="Karlodinium micrum, Strain CCMP2283" /LENGTH=80 /DNA_ID=CAMNT_0009141115 /DNA_START=135 /DNA_END=377 /DNA_ORIENTATION=-
MASNISSSSSRALDASMRGSSFATRVVRSCAVILGLSKPGKLLLSLFLLFGMTATLSACLEQGSGSVQIEHRIEQANSKK